jgi:hypothetical protein
MRLELSSEIATKILGAVTHLPEASYMQLTIASSLTL